MFNIVPLLRSIIVAIIYYILNRVVFILLMNQTSFRSLNSKKRGSFCIFVVSCINATLVSFTATYLMFNTQPFTMKNNLKDTTASTQALMEVFTGYFIYDLLISVKEESGKMFILHAVMSLLLYSYASMFRFMHYYGLFFMQWEFSTIFIDMRSMLKLMVFALITFSYFRIVRGVAVSVNWYSDAWNHWNLSSYPISTASTTITTSSRSSGGTRMEDMTIVPAHERVALLIFLIANILFHGLNFMWFGKMIGVLRKRQIQWQKSTHHNNSTNISDDSKSQ